MSMGHIDMNAFHSSTEAPASRWKAHTAKVLVAVAAWHAMLPVVHAAQTALADVPIAASTEAVPANVMMALSVEFPTAQSHANFSSGAYNVTALPANASTDPYFEPTRKYLGYFDPTRCYAYSGTESDGYFYPTDSVQGTNYTCSKQWSGNYMNWATMHVIDLFRWAMTGGARDVDGPADFSATTPTGATILKKAWSNSQGGLSNFPDKSLPYGSIDKYTALSASGTKNLVARVYNKGINVEFSYSNDNSASTKSSSYQVRVQVCNGNDPTKHEYQDQFYCQKYENTDKTKAVYKPVGLIQKNIKRMRFGAVGYHNLNEFTYGDDTLLKAWDGGVLKAQIRDTSAEILDTGAFLQDPWPADRQGDTEVTRTGAINYLNLFGYKAKSYKRYDNVSEMYAVALRYLLGPSGIGHVASYSVIPPGVTAAQRPNVKDDFPVITKWIDPVLPANQGGSCQKQFIIGIGDTNTCGDGCDNNLSGSGYSMDSLVAGERFAGQTVKDWVLKLSGYNLATDYIAGMAFAANTKSLRTDFPDARIKTFWVDALEYSQMAANNQYFKAAKYGAFTDTNKNGVPDNGEWNALGQKYRSDTIPDAYFPASDPDRLLSGLNSAFSQINSLIGSASGVGVTGSVISDSLATDGFFQSTYGSQYWSGDVKGLKINSINLDTGKIDFTTMWSAASKLDTLVNGTGWDASRKVVTLAPDSNSVLKGVPFRLGNLSTAQKTTLGSTTTEQTNVLSYLRGDLTNQSTLILRKAYRYRASVLGDIVNSAALVIGPPNQSYSDAYNPGYSTFVSSKASRKPVVYVGANDGMLHAFDATLTTAGGNEIFAVVPNAVFQGPDGKPGESGLRALSDNSYLHHYYVDATPFARDVDFKRAGGTVSTDPNSYDWRTLLVFGLGKGGRSYVAMDVTDVPTSTTTEASIASKVLWEFTHEDLGYSYGRPAIIKTRKWGWVVIVAGGYNNTLGTSKTSVPGKGVLFVLDPKTGTLLQKIYTSGGSATNPAGLAHLSGYAPDSVDMTMDYAYAGDLLGNVWRFDFSSATADVPNPTTPIMLLRDAKDNPQPVTTEPRVDPGPDLVRYLFVGTGKLLHTTDRENTQQQTFYALRDGTAAAPYSSDPNAITPLPNGITFPIQRSNMVKVNSLLEGVIQDSSRPMGWFYDLTGVRGTLREQIVQYPTVNEGVVSWVGTLMNQDQCNPSGESAVYSTKYGSGKTTFSMVVDGVKKPIEFVSSTSGLAATKMVRIGSSIRLVGSKNDGSEPGLVGSQVGGTSDPHVLNWRIIGQ